MIERIMRMLGYEPSIHLDDYRLKLVGAQRNMERLWCRVENAERNATIERVRREHLESILRSSGITVDYISAPAP